MDQKLKNEWVENLRSGPYPQSSGRLRSTEGYCCLGVLADVIDPSLWLDHKNPYSYVSYEWRAESMVCSGRLPSNILPDAIQNQLIRMNDEGKDFLEIADWINKNL